MFVCSCFGITEQQVREHAASGACTPRQIASACKAGTDCGGCVRRIQSLLGRGTCPRRAAAERGESALLPAAAEPVDASASMTPASGAGSVPPPAPAPLPPEPAPRELPEAEELPAAAGA